MSFRWPADMREVARLTRKGRLGEVLTVLRSALMHPHSGPAARGSAAQAPAEALRKMAGLEMPGFAAPSLVGGRGMPRGRIEIPVPAGASFESGIYADAAGRLAYRLYVPSSYRGRAMPLIVMLHGCTQSPEDFAAGTGMNAVAEEQGFLVAYPEQNKTANASKCWNWFRPGDQARERGEPALIAGLTRQIISSHAVDASRVYVAGLSAGGAAAAIMGAAYPDLFAAIGIHSGLPCGAASDLPSALAAMRQGGSSARRGNGEGAIRVPTIVFHGDQDKTVHPDNGDRILAQAGQDGQSQLIETQGSSPNGMRFTRIVRGDQEGRPVLEQWRLHGAGHAWSGGSAQGSYTDPRGPDASREMARFFAGHSLRSIP